MRQENPQIDPLHRAREHAALVAKREKQLGTLLEFEKAGKSVGGLLADMRAELDRLHTFSQEDSDLMRGLNMLAIDNTPKPDQAQTESVAVFVDTKLQATSLATTQSYHHSRELRLEAGAVLERMVGSIPERILSDMVALHEGRMDITRAELEDMAEMVVGFRAGIYQKPTPLDFLPVERTHMLHGEEWTSSIQLTPEDKKQKARLYLQSLIATVIVDSDGNVKMKNQSMMKQLSQEINQLLFLLNDSKDSEIVRTAIQSLSVVERTMITRGMSTSIKEKLEHVDLDECSEEQAAYYLFNAVSRDYHRTSSARSVGQRPVDTTVFYEESLDRFEKILSTCFDRCEEGFDVQQLAACVRELNTSSHAHLFYRRMIQMGKYADLQGHVAEFLLRHPDTAEFAREIDDVEYIDNLEYEE
jgi:hypothetical protein